GIDAVITSPPFVNQSLEKKFKSEEEKQKFLEGQRISHPGRSDKTLSNMMDRWNGITYSKKQIGKMKEGDVHGVVTSPPFEDSIGSDDPKKRGGLYRDPKRAKDKNLTGTYGKSEGQLGKEKGETYWEAMKQVYIECWKILKKDGHMAIVVKDFYRKGQRVPLCDNTVRLLENIGFKTVYRIRAWTLTETIHDDLFKGETVNRKERKSFFRRNYESKFPNNRIDWEEILICKKISV
ncbi:MAG: DNA methyltransferase, partial [Candidatus Paceibacterota bacterium]